MTVQLGSHPCHLLPQGAVLINQTLYVADLHLGKDATFRAKGVPVPQGSTESTLHQLLNLIQTHNPSTITILGDIFHSLTAAQAQAHLLENAIQATLKTQWQAIPGNHDHQINLNQQIPSLTLLPDPAEQDRIKLHHHPPEDTAAPSLSGHLHPVYPLKLPGVQKRCRAFWLRDQRLVLPAFGEFTGGYKVPAEPTDRLFLIVGNRVITPPKTK